MEVSGTVVRLPTDEAVLNHPEFKQRGFAVGSKVATVSLYSTPPRAMFFLHSVHVVEEGLALRVHYLSLVQRRPRA
jgi:NADPH2:quinone reductase